MTVIAKASLEPWRALLAAALWLDEGGQPGLFGRMEDLSVAYQAERATLESPDLTALVIQALCCYADAGGHDVNNVTDVNAEGGEASFSCGR